MNMTAINANKDPFCWLDKFFIFKKDIEKQLYHDKLFTSADLYLIAGAIKIQLKRYS